MPDGAARPRWRRAVRHPYCRRPRWRRWAANRIRRAHERREKEEELARIERERKEMEEERAKEAIAQKKLRTLGLCSMGYRWIKQNGGYRCAGGSHYVSDPQLEMTEDSSEF